MEQLPKIVAQRLQAVSRTETHPDANLLAAFAEKSLLPREQAQILEHLSACAECRGVLAHAQPEEVLQRTAVAAAAPMPVRHSWFSRATVRWAALAACVVVVGAAVISRTQFKQNQPVALKSEPAVVAKSESQPQPPALSAPAEEAKENTHAAMRKYKGGSDVAAKRDTDQLAELDKQREANTTADGAMGERHQAGKSVGGLIAGNNSPVSSADTVTTARAAAAPVVAQQQEDAKSNKKEFSADKAMKAPASTNEVVQVQAQAAPPPPPPPAAAKTATTLADSQLRRSESGNLSAYREKDGYFSGGAVGGLAGHMIAIPMWQLSSDGKLVKSLDHGQNWQPVAVTDNAVFRALCVTGSEIWVGGNQGTLFYSSDFGQQWEPVKPIAKGQTLTADITAIEFKDAKHGKVTTADHQIWATTDGGHAWKIESR